jgi:O-antigen/teichoic acid export membrane protein
MSLIRNSGIVVAGAFIANVLAYVFNIYTARLLGPSEYGSLGSLLALFYLASIIYGPVLSVVTKEVAFLNSKNENTVLSQFFNSIRKEVFILLSIILITIISCSGLLSKYLKIQNLLPIIITAFLIMLSGLLQFNQSVLSALKQYTIISKSKIIEAFIRVSIACILLYFGAGLNGVLISFGLAYLFVLLWTQKFIPQNLINKNEKNYKLNRADIYFMGIKFFLASLFFQISINISSIYIQHYYSSTVNGYWTAGMNVSRITLLFSDGVNQVLYPELVGEVDSKRRKKLIKIAMVIIFLISGSSAVMCWIMPDFIINLIYGSKYINATKFLKWQSLLMIIISLIQLYFTVYFSKTNKIESIKETEI